MKFGVFSLLLVCVFYGCAHQKPSVSQDQGMSLDKIERLQLGSSSGDIEKAFGKPTDIFPTSPARHSTEWFYADGDYNRMAFEVQDATGLVTWKFWDVRDGDPERDVKTALGRYPEGHFELRESTLPRLHGRPGYAQYVDQTLGISIRIRKGTNLVESISWCKNQDNAPPCRE